MGAEGGQGLEGREQGEQRGYRGCGSVVSHHPPTLAPCRGSGRQAAPRQLMARPGEQVGGRHRPQHPGARRRPPSRGSVPFHRRPGHGGDGPSTVGVRTWRRAGGETAPLTGGRGGAADPSPPSRWALPLRDGASHPPRPSASPLPAVTHRLAHPAGRDARPGERSAEV